MIATDHYGRRYLARSDEIVERDTEACPLPLPQPADTRWQTLKGNSLASESDPALQMLIMREQLEN